jgi:hypothetical protein
LLGYKKWSIDVERSHILQLEVYRLWDY